MMKKFGFVMVFAFVVSATMAMAAVGSAQEIPAPEQLLAEPVRAAEAAEPVKAPVATENEASHPVTPAERLAAEKGLTLEEAREILLAAGVDPDATPQSIAEEAGYDESETVDLYCVKVFTNSKDGRHLVDVYQGHGKPRRGDRKYLYARARAVRPHTDMNGFADDSSALYPTFGAEKAYVVYGLVVASQRTMTCRGLDGKPHKIWFNVIIDTRGREDMDDSRTDQKEAGAWLTYAKQGNIREGFDERALNYIYMSPNEFFLDQMEYGRDLDKMKELSLSSVGDPSYFAYYLAKPGEVIDVDLVCDKLLLNGEFRTLTRWLPERPDFVGGPKLVRLDKSGKPLPERTNTGKKASAKSSKKGKK